MNKIKKNILDFSEKDIPESWSTIDSDNTVSYNLPWIEKYRPDTFNDIVSHIDILNALEKMINNNGLPHLIFYGPPGTGKTTTILACAKKMYGSNFKNMTLELNGSEDRGINVVREQIKDFSGSKQFISNFSSDLKNNVKLVILDEADSMTYDAQFALRRVIENYTNNTRFCLICNYETKIITALKSRCMIFRFSPIPIQVHFQKLKTICDIENVNINKDALSTIISLVEGDMRKSINLIQSIYTALKITNKQIMVNDVYKQIGYPSISDKKKIIDILFDKNINLSETIIKISILKSKLGLTTNDILKDISLILVKEYYDMPNITKIFDILGTLENYMSISFNDTIMLANIISVIKNNIC
jgi:replication factor C subunit 3/5